MDFLVSQIVKSVIYSGSNNLGYNSYLCRSTTANRMQCQRDISESFYQDYTGGHKGGVGTGVSTKGWGTYHGRDMYLGNALCNLAHDPAAPHVVNKNDLLRNISRTYSRPRSAVSYVLYCFWTKDLSMIFLLPIHYYDYDIYR